jgi:hypothetical protein
MVAQCCVSATLRVQSVQGDLQEHQNKKERLLEEGRDEMQKKNGEINGAICDRKFRNLLIR